MDIGTGFGRGTTSEGEGQEETQARMRTPAAHKPLEGICSAACATCWAMTPCLGCTLHSEKAARSPVQNQSSPPARFSSLSLTLSVPLPISPVTTSALLPRNRHRFTAHCFDIHKIRLFVNTSKAHVNRPEACLHVKLSPR